jgi:hypothetical protein
VSVKILLSPSQPDSWHMKKRKFSKSTLRVSKLNSMSAELFLVFLPVGITVEREILTVRKISRVGQNSSKSQPDSGRKRNIVVFGIHQSRALKAVGTVIPTCPGHFLPKSEANCGGQRPTTKKYCTNLPSSGHC